MPQICYFYGITIYIQFLDHNPPHIHAVYQLFKAQYSIDNAKLLKGKMPGKADQLICNLRVDQTSQTRTHERLGSR